jgi:hypothetical protein
MEAREAELLPVPYFHQVFTLPAPVADIAYRNKAAIYDLLFKAFAETMLTIAADPKHLGARTGFISVLHTWGSAMTHHPHMPPDSIRGCAHDRPRRRHLAGWHALDFLPARLLSAGAGAFQAVPPAHARKARRRA